MTSSTLSRVQRAQASAIAALGYPLVAVLGKSCRWRVDGYEHYEAVRATARQPIFAFWHGRILSAAYFWRGRGIVVMTSENFDGEWIARIIRRFGYGTARGSTTRGGRRALAQLRRDMRNGQPVAFTVDGPRGPSRSVQPGAVWLGRADRQSDSSVSRRGQAVLVSTELGPHPGAEAVQPRRGCDR